MSIYYSRLDDTLVRYLRQQWRAMHFVPLYGRAQLRARAVHPLALDLLDLSADVDPIDWLRSARANQTAVHTISELIRRLEYEYRGLQRLRAGHTKLPEFAEGLPREFERAWRIDVAEDPFLELRQPGPPAAHTLQNVLKRIRGARAENASVFGDMRSLMEDILRLPDEVVALKWLVGERAAAIATLTFVDVMRALLPHPTRESANDATWISTNKEFAVTSTSRLHFETLGIFSEGFILNTVVSNDTEALHATAEREFTMLLWEGLDEVADDTGYRYVLIYDPPEPIDADPDTYRVRVWGWPAVSAEAKSIHCSANQTRFTMLPARDIDGPITAESQIVGAEVALRIEVR
jgi:hypothetical protein